MADRFKIFHHVVLPFGLLTAADLRQDGSLVGSCGYMGLHDGFERFLVVKRGRALPTIDSEGLWPYHLAAALPDGRYEMQDYQGHTRAASLAGSRLVLAGDMKPVRVAQALKPETSPSEPSIEKLFPVPVEMRDHAGIENVDWWRLKSGSRLGVANISISMEYGHRVAYQDPAGRLVPLEQCIPGLSRYTVDGIWFVSHQGWFVVSASIEKWDPRAGIRTGFGNELFWIEWRPADKSVPMQQ